MSEKPVPDLVAFAAISAETFFSNLEHRMNRDGLVVGAVVRAYFSDFLETFLAGDVRITSLDEFPGGLLKVTAELRVSGIDELLIDSDLMNASSFIIKRVADQEIREGFFGNTMPDATDNALRAMLANELNLVSS